LSDVKSLIFKYKENMIKKLLLALLVITSCVKAAEYQRISRFVIIGPNGQEHEVQQCFVDPLLRDVPAHKLNEAIKHFNVRVVSVGNGEYGLRSHVRCLGGGPLSAGPAALAAAGTVWAAYGALCSTEGPVCAAHYLEFQSAATIAYNVTYAAVFVCPWLP